MPEKNLHTHETSLPNKARRLARVGAASLALFSAGFETRQASADEPLQIEPIPEFIIGAQEDSVLSEDLSESMEIAGKIKEAGFNTLKVTMPWTYPKQCAEVKNDKLRFQNAVTAAREHRLQVMLNLIPGGGGGLGNAPTTESQQRCIIDTSIAVINTYEEISPRGHLILEWPNEPNSKTFWRQQTNSEGEWVAPKQVMRLMNRGYSKVKAEAEKIGIGLTVVGGALDSTNQTVAFTQGMGLAGVKGKSMDAMSWHPYPLTNTEAPDMPHPELSAVGIADAAEYAKVVNRSIEDDLPVIMSEWGYKTRIEPAKQHLYTIRSKDPKILISEDKQAEFYSKGLRMAACTKRVGGLVLFNVIDDADGHWTSGIWYPDKSPKSSYDEVTAAIAKAKSGELNCRQ